MSEEWRVPREDEDPLLRSARRELKVAVLFWAVFAAWALGLGKLLAYRKPPEGEMINMIMGMPSWVFWVVMLPWFLATLFTLWFALRFMKDHDLLADSGMNEDGTPIVEAGEKKGNAGEGREE